MAAAIDRYLGAYALCVEAGQMLLVRNSGGDQRGSWTLPGGGVEPAEHPDDTVRRELTEETGLRGIVVGVAGVYARHHPADERVPVPVDHIGVVYELTDLAGEMRDETDGTSDRCAWFARPAIDRLPLTSLAEFGVGLAWP